MEAIEKTQVEQIEQSEPSISASATVETNGLHESLEAIADGFDVTGFKCVKCGLVHMHDTTKHRLSDTFDIGEDDAASNFEYNSVCHCGVQEAARTGSDHGIDEGEASRIAEGAPIPPEHSREMDDELGTI